MADATISLADYLDYVRDPATGYLSVLFPDVLLPGVGGLE